MVLSYEKARTTEDYTIIYEQEGVKRYGISKYRPREDLQRLIDQEEASKETLWVFIGYSLGYQIEHAINKVGNRIKGIIIEKNEDDLKKQKQLGFNFTKQEVTGLIEFTGEDMKVFKELYTNLVKVEDIKDMCIVLPKYYHEAFSTYCKQIFEIMQEVNAHKYIMRNTVIKYKDTNVQNIIQNLEYIRQGHDIKQHKNKYKGIPAVVVSAGPSLQKNINELKNFNGIIFTGGRTLPLLVEKNIEPHFLVSVDAGDVAYTILGSEGESMIPLITTAISNNKVVRKNRGPKYFISGGYEGTQEILGETLEDMPIGGSVASLCVSAADYMGCNPIIMIGQDLAYTNNRSHANAIASWGISPESGNYKPVKGYYGDEVWSDHSFITFLRWFEEYFDNNKQVTFINATEGGAYIEGAIHLDLREAIIKYMYKDKIIVEHIRDKRKAIDCKLDINKYINKLEELSKEVIKATKNAKLLKLEYETYKGIRKQKIQELIQKLDSSDKVISKNIQQSNMISDIFYAIFTEINKRNDYREPLEETEQQRGIRIAEKSYKIYISLEEALCTMIKLVKEAVEEDRDERTTT